jgi:PAS domain S-box-containing protein
MPAEIDKHLLDLGFDVTKHTNAMLSYYDKNLVCRFANNAYLDWFGLSPEDMINKMHLRDILGPLYEKNLTHIKGALNGKVQVFERPILTPSGITKTARATYFPEFENGKVKGFYVHVADVSPLPGVDGIFDAENENIHLFSKDRLLDEVVETLKSNILTGFPGISSLSKKHFISESKLKRDFKEKYNTTIFSFFRNLQMELAYKYITEKRCNKNQMAIMLNFSNPSNFSVCYQKY